MEKNGLEGIAEIIVIELVVTDPMQSDRRTCRDHEVEGRT